MREIPKFPLKLLKWFCKPEYHTDIEGDLLELYYRRIETVGLKKAKRLLLKDVLLLFRPGLIRAFKNNLNPNYIDMLQHNLILALRNFRKFKSQFLINLIGLSTGLTCVLIIFLWVADERQVDGFHKNQDQLFQIMSNHTDAAGISTWKGVPGLLLEEIQTTVPEAVNAVAVTDAHEYTLSTDESSLKVNGKFASQDFFDVFTYPLLEGDQKTVLSDKSGIIISQSLAKRLFKTTEAVGKSIDWHFWGKTKTLHVTGILQDIPQNSSEKFDFLMSWDYYHDDLINYKNWGNYYARIMVVLEANADQQVASAKMDAILKEKQESDRVDLFLAKYSDRYLYGNYENGLQSGGRIEYVNLFSIIAIFILFIASINFINLSIAKASHRTKEIGVKKSMGASRRSLIEQYLTESVLLSTLSLVVAFLVVYLLLPQFNYMAQKQLYLHLNSQLILTSMALILISGIIAGGYPAFYLSSFNPIKVLRGTLAGKSGKTWGRNALVVVQFTLSIVLIVSVIVVFKQMEFVKNKNLGYDGSNLIYFEREGKLIDNSEIFINELERIPGIAKAVVSGFMVGGENSTGGVDWEGKSEEDQIQFWEIRSGHGLIEIMDIELLEGRTFSNEFRSDSASVIFNETAIAVMGMEDPIGKTIHHYSGDKEIIGIVKDFNQNSLHTKVEPSIFLYEPHNTHFVMAKLEQGKEATSIENIEKLYKSFNPGYPFKYMFIDQDYQALYTSEERVSVLSKYFAGIAILISCLGLFGLITFTIERRLKEIGIRKVLGSGNLPVIYLLSSDFTKMVLIAIGIALPMSYIFTRNWLESFAYRIDLEWWFFAISGLVALLIAWLTVGIQTVKAANANPVQCLMDE